MLEMLPSQEVRFRPSLPVCRYMCGAFDLKVSEAPNWD